MMKAAHRINDVDLDFLAGTVAPQVRDRTRLKEIIELDEDFRDAFLSDEETSRKIVEDKEIFLRISPKLYFEILLRKTRKDLKETTHTLESEGMRKIAVFDSGDVVDLLSDQAVLFYLADMLSSFTRIQSYTLSFRSGKGIRHRIRFNDMDMDSLIQFSAYVDKQYRFGFYKRIADICLFIPSLYPEFVQAHYRYPLSGEVRPSVLGQVRRSRDDYVHEGRKFYKLAAEHPTAEVLELNNVFEVIRTKFHTAQKPLSFMSENYLHHWRQNLFGLAPR